MSILGKNCCWKFLLIAYMIMNFFTVLKNNWKKTVFFLAAGSYGGHYGWETIRISEIMKSHSKEAAIYGDQIGQYPKRVIVILNPAANKKKSEKTFRKYCEPILHLAGFIVDIKRTDSEGYAKTYMEQLRNLPNAVIIAGGDGTVSEVLTGMLRRNSDRCPIGLLPLGKTNEIAKMYLDVSFASKVEEVNSLTNATMSIVRGYATDKSVFKIEQINNETNSESRAIFAMGYLKWGIGRDIQALREKYWYFGKAKTCFAVIMNAFNNNLTWRCKANVCYSSPCSGCTNCVDTAVKSNLKRSWLTNMFFKNSYTQNNDLLSINNDCKQQYNDTIDSSNVRIYVDDKSELTKLVLEQEENVLPGFQFIKKYLFEPINKKKVIDCREIKLIPDEYFKECWNSYSIDNEVYDVRPISLTLIPKAIQMYT